MQSSKELQGEIRKPSSAINAKKEETKRMRKTRDLFKKTRDTKGKIHAKMGSIKDRKGMDLTETEDIKRWQEYTEELYKKDLHDPDNHDSVITHLEPDILECEVMWALEIIITMRFSLGCCTLYNIAYFMSFGDTYNYKYPSLQFLIFLKRSLVFPILLFSSISLH